MYKRQVLQLFSWAFLLLNYVAGAAIQESKQVYEPNPPVTHRVLFGIEYTDPETETVKQLEVVAELYGTVAPKTVENFFALSRGVKGALKKGEKDEVFDITYKNTIFHRIIPNFVIQGGNVLPDIAPFSIYGMSFADEPFHLKHDRPGRVSMANSGPDSNASQFFFTVSEDPLESLDNHHVVFGPVSYTHLDVYKRQDKETVISLALMSSNAYVQFPYEGDWRNLTGWDNDVDPDQSVGIGWDEDGVRGHIFANEDSSVIVIALKGTSAQGLPGSGDDETTEKDKLNDNVLFSCCCARISYLWKTACDCYVRSYTCDEVCLEKELTKKDRYYQAVLDIYRNVIREHPNAAIWITGHSLGGALASLLGRTFGAPAVAFEAPGELLATRRLHLPMPPGLPAYQEGVWHIGHTADPIFMGTCNGASSTCSIAGYAMETSCHSGKVCVYDVVTDKGWHVNMLNHRIHTVIDGVLNDYDQVAKCKTPDVCHDCYNWNYIRGRTPPDKEKKTSKTSKVTKPTYTSSISVNPPPPEKTTSSCVGRNWIGICTEYGM